MAVEFYQLCPPSNLRRLFGTILSAMLQRDTILWISLVGLCWLSACGRASAAKTALPTATRSPSSAASAATATRAKPETAPSRSKTPTPGQGLTNSTSPASAGEHELAIAQANLTPSASVINPLTGLSAPAPELLERRPMAIKISNYPRDIRPQYGLNEADVVFEYYIEWGYTRFIGIFYGNDATQIGPVRSGRYFDEHLTRMYHAYYVFNYADPREYTYFLGGDLRQFMVVPGYGECPPFFQHRASTLITDVRHFETYFDSTRFAECLERKDADNSRQELRSTHFVAATPAAGVTVERIFTHYSRCDYNYLGIRS